MGKELLIGIAEAGVMHTQPAALDLDTRFRMVRNAGVFDYRRCGPSIRSVVVP